VHDPKMQCTRGISEHPNPGTVRKMAQPLEAPAISVVMPVFNESEGISEFISELNLNLGDFDVKFIVVDDCSSDTTIEILEDLQTQKGIRLEIVRNSCNLGHGQSTIRALRYGLKSGADVIIAVDGDGQIEGVDVKRLVNVLVSGNFDIVEGVRKNRTEPIHRRLITLITRILVWSRSRVVPKDANTPFRAYRKSTLHQVLDSGRINNFVPNLAISAFSRSEKLKIAQSEIQFRLRRGSLATGTSWGPRHSSFPSKKLMLFCLKATTEWFGRNDSKSSLMVE
jgi:dolichol-phosphate mannosyltransferase